MDTPTQNRFDVIVIGGGHAGCEAADAAARLGAPTLLLTHSRATIGEMSCNPAIGGLAKGHLVREIDALDGLMARTIDRAGIQFRVLNRSKGHAVGGVRGVVTATGERIEAGAVVITTGTFLRGLIHIGEEKISAGRVGEKAAIGLAQTLARCAFRMGRLKTGTPPRLDGKTIDWAALESQPGDEPPPPFSFLTARITTPQINCAITGTTPASHDLIRANLHRAPMYSGQIEGVGPRYCPSIEDKV